MTDGPAPRQHDLRSVLGRAGGTATQYAGRTRAEHLAESVEADIRSRNLTAGEPMGTIEQIRAASGLARATVNEAIRLLADRGVLVVRPGRGGGVFVADQGPAVRMRRTLLDVREDPSLVADAVELRNHLEELIDVGAARCCGATHAAALRAQLAVMEAAADWPRFLRANWALHELLADLCPNAMARAVYVGTLGHLHAAAPRWDGGEKGEEPPDSSGAAEYRARRLEKHRVLVEAVIAGDEAAVRAAVVRHNAPD